MANFRPFKAWRYNPARVEIEKVIAPPYDVISPEEQNALYERSPFNCIRLILNQQNPSDTASDNRYTRAKKFFGDWRNKGILIEEEKPCFYLYRQVYEDPVSREVRHRLALLGRLKLEPFSSGVIVPHEKTLSRPREDRRKLLEATETNFSPVFGLYEDPQGKIPSLYSKITNRAPFFDVSDNQGVRHALWAIDDEKLIKGMRKEFNKTKIYIADGHHRYQTALEHVERKRRKEKIASDQEMPFDHVLMALVEFHDPGLALLPIHRIILPFKGFDEKKVLEVLKPIFKVEALKIEVLREKIKTASPKEMVFGLCLESGSYLLRLQNPGLARKKMPPGKPEVWYQLNVNVLSHLVLALLWNLPESEWESTLRYTASSEEAIRSVQKKKAAASFLMTTPRVETLKEMGKIRELMPQKSTYFYPKLASGLVFYHHCKS